jgi:hypothetical protein
MKGGKLIRDDKGLDAFKQGLKDLGQAQYVKIGYLHAGKGDEVHNGTTLTNAEIGIIQEFGSFENNIPPRSHIRMPIQAKSDEIKMVFNSRKVKNLMMAQEYGKVLELIGIAAEIAIQQAFESSGFGQWQVNSPATIKRKGSSRPLINTGALRRSITSEVVSL